MPLDIVEPSNLLGEGPLESCSLRVQLLIIEGQQPQRVRILLKTRPRDGDLKVRLFLKAPSFAAYRPTRASGMSNTYISKLNLAHFAQSTDDLSTNFIRNVKLGQRHVAGAEEGILGDRHNAEDSKLLATEGST